MAGYSLNELLVWMAGKSKTLGWDALVSYDQAKINMLMEQQYVSKVGEEEIIPPISQRIPGPGATNVITGMVLGNPLLSFESADLLNSKVNLTMPFLAGSFTTEIRSSGVPGHIDKMSVVVPGCDYVLTMIIELQGSNGAISGTSEVYLDLGTGVDFRVNFVETPEEQNRIGNFFKELYRDAPAEAKRFVLGMLDGWGDYALSPTRFYIRTQSAPTMKQRESISSGDGAVVLFVKTKAGNDQPDGSFPSPNSDFQYLIPNNVDELGNPLYSGTVLIASKTLFKNIIAPYYISKIPNGSFDIVNVNTTDLACSLQCTGGYYNASPVSSDTYTTMPPPNYTMYTHWAVSGEKNNSNNNSMDISHFLHLPCIDMRIGPVDNALTGDWNHVYSAPFVNCESSHYGKSSFQKAMTIDFSSSSLSTLAVDPTRNVVSFVTQTSSTNVALTGNDWLGGGQDVQKSVEDGTKASVSNAMNQFSHFAIPGIELFTLANLLFPSNNVLQLTNAYLPGDLACFGQLSPERSSFRIAPLQTTVVAGQTQQFRVDTPDYSNEPVLWSVQTVAGGLPGTIDANGLYRAPSPVSGSMAAQAHQDIVTATIGTGANLKQASAIAVVVNHAITVNPAFKLCDEEVRNVKLTAAAQSANVAWRMVSGDGTLNSVSGLSTTFTPNFPTSSPVQVSVIEARDVEQGDTCRSTILTLKSNTVLTFEIDPVSMEALGPLESKQLRVLSGGNEEDPTGFTWSLLSGGGSVSASGLYTAPDVIEDSCAVVWVTLAFSPTMKFYGYAVIPLKR